MFLHELHFCEFASEIIVTKIDYKNFVYAYIQKTSTWLW